MFIQITLYSKNKQSLENFVIFLNKMLLNKTILAKVISLKTTKLSKKRFTVIKSPHVNKRSQEHFETSSYKKTLLIISLQQFLIMLILKKVQKKIFNDVKLQLKFNISRKNGLKFFNLFLLKKESELESILKLLDWNGELLFLKLVRMKKF